jgi:hypothetical protein
MTTADKIVQAGQLLESAATDVDEGRVTGRLVTTDTLDLMRDALAVVTRAAHENKL